MTLRISNYATISPNRSAIPYSVGTCRYFTVCTAQQQPEEATKENDWKGEGTALTRHSYLNNQQNVYRQKLNSFEVLGVENDMQDKSGAKKHHRGLSNTIMAAKHGICFRCLRTLFDVSEQRIDSTHTSPSPGGLHFVQSFRGNTPSLFFPRRKTVKASTTVGIPSYYIIPLKMMHHVYAQAPGRGGCRYTGKT